jgi:archaellin
LVTWVRTGAAIPFEFFARRATFGRMHIPQNHEHFEVWVLQDQDTHWARLATFPDFDVAHALARTRSSRVRLVQTAFADGKEVSAVVLAEIGATRTKQSTQPLD